MATESGTHAARRKNVSKRILVCLAALVLLLATPSVMLAKGSGNEPDREKVLARLQKAQAEKRRVELKFKNRVTLVGRVGELREKGFTFEPDNKADADALKGMHMVAAVLYEDVASVQYPSKMRKFFKGVRTGFIGAGAFFVVMPIYGVQALLGDLPSC
jgi:hypothetical protein